MLSKVSLFPCLFDTDSTSSLTLSCTSGFVAREYSKKLRAEEDVSKPSPKNVIACAATSSSVKAKNTGYTSMCVLYLLIFWHHFFTRATCFAMLVLLFFNSALSKLRSISWPDENLTTYLEKTPSFELRTAHLYMSLVNWRTLRKIKPVCLWVHIFFISKTLNGFW